MDQLSGKVFLTGSELQRFTTLVPPGGSGVTLEGSLEPELARLSGARVSVRGMRHGGTPFGTFHVDSYEVMEVDGEVPRVGTLQARDGTLWLDGHDTVELLTPPVGLRAKAGAKVWIVGRPAGEGLAVQSYGILRENGR